MTDTLTTVPPSVIAGDSLEITWTHADYPRNGGWSASLYIAGASVASAITGGVVATDAAAHQFDVANTVTGALIAGTYQWSIRVTKAASVKTADAGVITVTADPATLADGDALSFEEKLLPIVEACITGTATGEMKRYMVHNRQIETFTLDELYRLRARLVEAIRAKRTGSVFGRVQVRFAA